MTRKAPCPFTADEQAGRLLDRDRARGGDPFGRRQADEALDLVGHANERIHRLAVAHARELQRNCEAEIGDERKRVRGIDGERREQREDMAQEMILEPGLLLFGHVRPLDQGDTLPDQGLAKLAPAFLLIAGQSRHRLGDQAQLLGRGETVGTLGGDAGLELSLEAGHPDHEEFIEVVGRNGQEAHPLEQRMRAIVRFLEHPAIEMEPGQFPIDEPIRARRQLAGARLRAPRRSDFFRPNSGLSAICHSLGLSVMKCHIGRASCPSDDMTARTRSGQACPKFMKIHS
jgi:hypothetical protein